MHALLIIAHGSRRDASDEEVRGKQAEHPQVRIRIADYLGASAGIPDLLLETASVTA